MAELYFRLVKAGLRTCNKENTKVVCVPDDVYDVTLELLLSRGYDADGNRV